MFIDNGSEFYNGAIKSWLEDNKIETYSPHNEGKLVAAGPFVRTLKNKIYKYTTAIWKNVYVGKLLKIVK